MPISQTSSAPWLRMIRCSHSGFDRTPMSQPIPTRCDLCHGRRRPLACRDHPRCFIERRTGRAAQGRVVRGMSGVSTVSDDVSRAAGRGLCLPLADLSSRFALAATRFRRRALRHGRRGTTMRSAANTRSRVGGCTLRVSCSNDIKIPRHMPDFCFTGRRSRCSITAIPKEHASMPSSLMCTTFAALDTERQAALVLPNAYLEVVSGRR